MAHQKNLLIGSEFLQPTASDPRPSRPANAEGKRRASRRQARAETAHEPEARWSPRRTLAFIVVSNGMFWAAVAAGVWALTNR